MMHPGNIGEPPTGSGEDASAAQSSDEPNPREVLEALVPSTPRTHSLADDLQRVQALENRRITSSHSVGVLTPARWKHYLGALALAPAPALDARSSSAPHWND